MRCCDPRGYGEVFDEGTARRNADAYRRRGLDATAKRVVAFLASRGLEGRDVLEIGGGVGAFAIELLRAGASRAVNVELSPAYEGEARALLADRGLAGRVERRIGDPVADASLGASDVVVLHRVVCCYADGAALMRVAARRARRELAVTFPRIDWWTRLGVSLGNLWFRLRGLAFRVYVHPERAVLGPAIAEGMRVVYDRQGAIWRSVVLERA